jgi:hypothetical protein
MVSEPSELSHQADGLAAATAAMQGKRFSGQQELVLVHCDQVARVTGQAPAEALDGAGIHGLPGLSG